MVVHLISQAVEKPLSGGSITAGAAVLQGCDGNFLPAGASQALLLACARELVGLHFHWLDFLPSAWVQIGPMELRLILQAVHFQQFLLLLLLPCALLVLRMIIVTAAPLFPGCVVPASPSVRLLRSP